MNEIIQTQSSWFQSTAGGYMNAPLHADWPEQSRARSTTTNNNNASGVVVAGIFLFKGRTFQSAPLERHIFI